MSTASPSPTPTPFAWCLAVGSTAVVATVLVVAGFAARGYSIALLQEEAASAASRGATLELLERPKFAPLFVRTASQVRDWRAVVDLVRQRRYDSALEALEAATFRKDPHSMLLANLIRETIDYQADDESVQPSRRDSLERRQALTLQGAAELKRAIFQQLGVTASDHTTELGKREGKSEEQETFYREGLLAGLPTLDGIPDGLADLKAASLYFPAIEHADKSTANAIIASLDSFRTRANDIRQQLTESQNELDSFDEAKQTFEQELKSKRQKVDETTRGAILALAEPKLSEPIVSVYSCLRIVSRKFIGKKLPELHSA